MVRRIQRNPVQPAPTSSNGTVNLVDTLEGEPLSAGVEAIIRLEAATSSNQWELARLYYRETLTKSLRQVADLVGQSHEHVRLMKKAWLALPYDQIDSPPPFTEVYQLAKAPEPKPELPAPDSPADSTVNQVDTPAVLPPVSDPAPEPGAQPDTEARCGCGCPKSICGASS